jgi:hypothetical protein
MIREKKRPVIKVFLFSFGLLDLFFSNKKEKEKEKNTLNIALSRSNRPDSPIRCFLFKNFKAFPPGRLFKTVENDRPHCPNLFKNPGYPFIKGRILGRYVGPVACQQEQFIPRLYRDVMFVMGATFF